MHTPYPLLWVDSVWRVLVISKVTNHLQVCCRQSRRSRCLINVNVSTCAVCTVCAMLVLLPLSLEVRVLGWSLSSSSSATLRAGCGTIIGQGWEWGCHLGVAGARGIIICHHWSILQKENQRFLKSILAGVDTLWLKIVIVVIGRPGVGNPSSSMLGLRVVAATRDAGLVGMAGDGNVIVGLYQGKINGLTVTDRPVLPRPYRRRIPKGA